MPDDFTFVSDDDFDFVSDDDFAFEGEAAVSALTVASAPLSTDWVELSTVDYTAGTLPNINACITEVESKLGRGTLSTTTTPSTTDLKRWLIHARQELSEFRQFTWRRKTAIANLTSGSYRYSLPPDYSGGRVALFVNRGREDDVAIPNSDFEDYTGTQDDGTSDSFSDWAANNTADGRGDIIEATATTRAGSSAVKITSSTGANPQLVSSRFTSITSGGNFKLSLWTRGDGVNSLKVSIVFRVPSNRLLGESTGITGTIYTRKDYTLKIPAHEFFNIYLQSSGAGVCYVDQISLKEIVSGGDSNKINIISPHQYDVLFPDPSEETGGQISVACIKNLELWVSPPSGNDVVELEYEQTGGGVLEELLNEAGDQILTEDYKTIFLDNDAELDISWMPEIERFRCCDFATSKAFAALQEFDGAVFYYNKWKHYITKAIRADGKRRLTTSGYRARSVFQA